MSFTPALEASLPSWKKIPQYPYGCDEPIAVRVKIHLVERAGPLETVFHRAFDLVTDPEGTLDALAATGISRILTSGQAPASLEGAPLIRRLLERAAGRLDILPGGGVRAATVAGLVAATGARGVHLGPQLLRIDASGAANPRITFGLPGAPPDQYPSLDAAAVRAVRTALDAIRS